MVSLRNSLIRDPALHPVAEKVRAEERLTRADGLTLFRSPDLAGLGHLARFAKERRYGKRITYVINRQINPTNYCALSCTFCDFAVKRDNPEGYEYTIPEILAMLSPEVREVHITGGLHPQWPYAYYLDLIRAIRETYPAMQIKAWTAVEIDWFARLTKRDPAAILREMKASGVDSMPGGGAEVFSDRVRMHLFRQKTGADTWEAIHRAAHAAGLKSNATLLYGHIETVEERVDHMLRLRRIQDDTEGFLAFIPLSYQRGTNGVIDRDVPPAEDLRTIAAARLLLDNIPHIKAYWVMLGLATTTLALTFGADDMDGTIGRERIAHAALAGSPAVLARARIVHIIRDAGLEPQERNALHQPVEETAAV